MSECRFCSAPVNRKQGFCSYCRSRLEMDLHGGVEYRLYEPESERICPHCDIPLATIDLKIDKKFLIEKCDQCSGLFFDPGELEMLMDRSVSNVFHVDHKKLEDIQLKNFQAREKEFKYIKCPACRNIMNRRVFGYKSGVIVDHCRSHGYWLDEGELRQLQEWKKAGGELRQKKSGRNSDGQIIGQKPEKASGNYAFSSSRRESSTLSERLGTSFDMLDIFTSFLD